MSNWEVQQYANKRPFINIDRACFMKTVKEIGIVYTIKKELGKTKRHKFRTILKVSF